MARSVIGATPRALLLGVVALAAWQLLRLASIVVTVLVHGRPRRIGHWFRFPGAVHHEIYRDERRYAAERSRAGEEGWRVASEERTAAGIAVTYERYEPALGSAEIDLAEAEDTRT